MKGLSQHNDYIEIYNIPEETIEESKQLLSNFLGQYSEYIKDFNGAKYLDFKYSDNSLVFEFKEFFNKILSSNEKFMACFFLDQQTTGAILRSMVIGSHMDFFNRFNELDADFKKHFFENMVYNFDFDNDNDFVSVNELLFITNGNLLGILTKNKLGIDEKEDIDITDYYSDLTDKQFNAIINEVLYGIIGGFNGFNNNYIIENYPGINPFFFKKLLESDLSDGIKKKILDLRDQKRNKRQINKLKRFYPNLEEIKYLELRELEIGEDKSTKNIVEQVINEGNTNLVNPQTNGVNYSEVDESIKVIGDLIISQEKEGKYGYQYNIKGYNILLNLEEKKQKEIFKYIFDTNFEEAIALLRNRGKHVVNKAMIEDLDLENLLRILRKGFYDFKNFSDTDKEFFLEIDQFSIVKTILTLEDNVLINIFNSLDINEVKNLIRTLYYLRREKEYTTKNFRHLCKENIDQTKLQKASIALKTENEYIGNWIESEILQTEVHLQNSFDYNYLFVQSLFSDSININTITVGILHELKNSLSSYLFKKYNSTFQRFLEEEEEVDIFNVLIEILNILTREDLSNYEDNEKLFKIINDFVLFLGRKDFMENNIQAIKPLENFHKNLKGKIKVINDYKQLEFLAEDEIVVLNDYPTYYPDFNNKNKPKAIILSKDISALSHSYQFATKHNIPLYYLPKAENYFNYLNGVEVEISDNGQIQIINQENCLFLNSAKQENNKLKGTNIDSINLSGDFFYGVLQDYYGEIITDEFKQKYKKYKEENVLIRRGKKKEADREVNINLDFNEIVYFPYEHLKSIFDNIADPRNLDYNLLSRQVFSILDSIEIKDELLKKFIETEELKFPLALRSDFVIEDIDGERTPGLKESYLNIRNKDKLKKYLMEMIKQDFSPETLRFKAKNNIYFLNTTFGAIVQPMIIKNQEQVKNLLSGVFIIENKNGKYKYNGSLALGLNAGITDGTIKGIEISLEEGDISYTQEKYVSLDEENGGLKTIHEQLNLSLDRSEIDKLKEIIKQSIGEIEVGQKIQIEFSLLNYKNLEFEDFKLLQKNIL